MNKISNLYFFIVVYYIFRIKEEIRSSRWSVKKNFPQVYGTKMVVSRKEERELCSRWSVRELNSGWSVRELSRWSVRELNSRWSVRELSSRWRSVRELNSIWSVRELSSRWSVRELSSRWSVKKNGITKAKKDGIWRIVVECKRCVEEGQRRIGERRLEDRIRIRR